MRQLSFEGLGKKIAIAIERLKTFEPPEGYYVAISGGKDSTVVYDLVKKANVKADFHYNVTNLDAPETIRFIKQYMPDVKFDFPTLTFWKLLLKKKIPPTRIARWCCAELKEKGGEGRLVVTGIRWNESNKRRNRKMIENCYNRQKRFLHVIIDWTEADVWDYIQSNNLPYNPLYDRGYKK